MPTRILRDWTDSTSVETLSPEAERLFVRLIMKADDYGRYHADPRLVLAGCLPLVRQATVNLVIAWLGDLEKAGLITTYAADNGRKYLEINKFGQRTRAEKSKFPDPSTPVVGQVSVKCQTDDGQPRSESESDTKSETKTDTEALPEPFAGNLDFVRTWDEWKKFRKGLKACKNFEVLFRKQLEWLSKFPQGVAVEILNTSMRNGWQGLFDPAEKRGGTKPQTDIFAGAL